MKKLPSHEEVLEFLDYDPETGLFHWKKRRKTSPVKVGAVAGSHKKDGYISVYLGTLIKAHRLAWFYVHGEWPAGEVDHINGVKTDNRIANLRIATREQNMRNRGPYRGRRLKGVNWHTNTKRWRALIRVDGKQFNLGYFKSAEDAHAAYRKAAKRLHKEFARV